MRIRAAAALLGCGIALSGVAGIGPANASTALTLVTMGCIPQGDFVVECFATVSGGTTPYTYHWSNNPNANSDDQTSKCSTAPPNHNQVNLTVDDSAGGQVSGTRYFACQGGPPH